MLRLGEHAGPLPSTRCAPGVVRRPRSRPGDRRLHDAGHGRPWPSSVPFAPGPGADIGPDDYRQRPAGRCATEPWTAAPTIFSTNPSIAPVLGRVRNMLALRTSQSTWPTAPGTWRPWSTNARPPSAERERELIVHFRAAEFRDPETSAHIQRMAHYSHLIADALGLPEADPQAHPRGRRRCTTWARSAFPTPHPLEAGRLTPEEFEIMKGAMPGSVTNCSRAAARHGPQGGGRDRLRHHEKFDGSGYPNRLAGRPFSPTGASWRWPTSSTP